jgi:hypothetical protein
MVQGSFFCFESICANEFSEVFVHIAVHVNCICGKLSRFLIRFTEQADNQTLELWNLLICL